MTKVIGVESDGSVEWHIPGCGGGDYATLCGMDGNDPCVGQTGTLPARRGQKITCRYCRQIWLELTALGIRRSDFVNE